MARHGPSPASSVTSLLFVPRHRGLAFALVSHGLDALSELWATPDGGASWARAEGNLPLDSGQQITAIAIDPRSHVTVYAFVTQAGIFRSADGGHHWTQAIRGPSPIEASALAVDADSGALFAGTWMGIFRSTDRGRSWRLFGLQGKPTASVIVAVNRNTVFAGGDGLYRTTDAGSHWTRLALGVLGSRLADLAIQPSSSANLLAVLTERGGGVFRSVDGGDHWQALTRGLPSGDALAVAFDPARTSTLYVGFAADGVFRTTNGGGTWAPARAGMRALSVEQVALDPSRPGTIYVGPTARGLFKSVDAGHTWIRILATTAGEHVRTGLGLDRAHPETIYASDGILLRSDDGGSTWAQLGTDLPNADIFQPLAVDPVNSGTLYAGNLEGVYRSTDSGDTWTLTSNDLASECLDPWSLQVSPADPRILFTGGPSAFGACQQTGGTYESEDSGESWHRVEHSVAFHPSNPSIFYASTRDGVVRSIDGGLTFTPTGVADSTPRGAGAMLVDPTTPEVIYLAAFDGMFRSADSGATWQVLGSGTQPVYVSTIATDSAVPGRLWVATTHGVFVLDPHP